MTERNENLQEVIDERVRVYGEPTVTFPQIAQVWSGYLGTEIEPTDVPIMLMLMKAVRVRQAPDYSDNSDDIEGYLDIFRKLVGKDMVKARSVDDYVKQKYGEPTPEPVHVMRAMIHRSDGFDCSGCQWTTIGLSYNEAVRRWHRHHGTVAAS